MRTFSVVLSFLLLSTMVQAQEVALNLNMLPTVFANPLAMTITQVLVGPHTLKANHGELTLMPERKSVFLLEKESNLKFSYNLQKDKSAPLVFVIPGTGGSSHSQSAEFVAEQLFNLGYQTVVIDDPFSWNFAIAGSKTGLPGYLPRDAKDAYVAMQKINALLQSEFDVQPSSYSLVGSSLGGLVTLFINQIDTQFHFSKILMINPPLDLLYAVRQLDRLYDAGETLSPTRKSFVFNQVLDVAGSTTEKTDLTDRNFIQSTFTSLGLSQNDMSYLIAMTFRNSLRDIVFTSQQINDTGILKSPVSRYRRNGRYEEAYKFSFGQYLNMFVFPNVRQQKTAGYTIETMNQETSIYQFADTIKNDKNVYLIHSTDDFLLKQGDVQWLKSNFGPRATLFPYGGHMGSMNSPEFTSRLQSIFKR